MPRIPEKALSGIRGLVCTGRPVYADSLYIELMRDSRRATHLKDVLKGWVIEEPLDMLVSVHHF